MTLEERRQSAEDAYLNAGFQPGQARVLAAREVSQRKPWRREVVLLGALFMAISTIGWIDSKNQSEAIQENREHFVLEECQDVNQRNEDTLEALEDLKKGAIAEEPERAEEITEGTKRFKLIVNALVPERNCKDRVALATPEE